LAGEVVMEEAADAKLYTNAGVEGCEDANDFLVTGIGVVIVEGVVLAVELRVAFTKGVGGKVRLMPPLPLLLLLLLLLLLSEVTGLTLRILLLLCRLNPTKTPALLRTEGRP